MDCCSEPHRFRVKLSNSEVIRTKIDLFSARMAAEASAFWSHPDFSAIYREYIVQSYSVIRASVPLMNAGADACGMPEFRTDPVCAGFGAYLRHHIPEETGHHEWILNDGEV